METDYTQKDSEITKVKENLPKIFAKRVILGFSILFTPIFGGILLYKNLREIGKKKEGTVVLIISAIFTIIALLLVLVPTKSSTSATFILNIGGGFLLAEYFFKKFIPDESIYEKKKIWIPLLFALLITFVLLILYIYSN
jgi:hypothetical protein